VPSRQVRRRLSVCGFVPTPAEVFREHYQAREPDLEAARIGDVITVDVEGGCPTGG